MASGSQNMTTFKAKGLTSIESTVDTSNLIFLKTTALTAEQLGNTVSLSLNATSVTNAAYANHSVFLNIGIGSGIGTPFQLQICDSSHLYIYKRWYTSDAWSAWNKISAGHADDAAIWTTTRTFTIGNTGKSVNGSANVSWSKDEILGASTSAYFLRGDKTWSNDLVGSLNLQGNLTFTNSGTAFRGINYGTMGDNDQWRIGGAATASNAGYMEIATADDGTEPIYVRQYTGVFTTLTRTLTLLDGSGNTSTPGSITASGYLKSTLNGNTVTIGSANGLFMHFQNSANIPFWFNKEIQVQGNVLPYGNCAYNFGSTSYEIANTYTRAIYARHYDSSGNYTGDYNMYYGYNRCTNHYFYRGSTGGGQAHVLTINRDGITVPQADQWMYFNNSGTTLRGIRWQCADNDYGRIACGGSASNSGYLEIATADDGTEPIYIRQYTGVFSSLTRTLTLLNESGNTYFPGNVYIGSSGAGGYLYGGASNGGINSILLGDDVWLGDCNVGGIMGMKSTGATCGFYMYNSGGTRIGIFTLSASGGEIRCDQPINFLTLSGACQHARFGRIGLADSYASINLGSYRLHVVGNARVESTLSTYNVSITGGGNLDIGATSGNDQGDIVWWHSNGNESVRIWTGGGFSGAQGPLYRCFNSGGTLLYSGTLVYGSGSSRTIKHNIHSIMDVDALKILQLRPVEFEYNQGCGPNGMQAGLISEEAFPFFPYVTYDIPMYMDKDVSNPSQIVKGIYYDKLVPYLIKLAQIQQKEIDQLKIQLSLLQQKNQA